MAKVLVDKDFLEGGLELICDSIRLKTGGTGVLAFPVEIKQAVDSIETGGGGITPSGTKEITENGEGIDVTTYAAVNVNVPVGTDTSDATASAADIRAGQTAYVNGAKVTGSAAEQPATTWTPTTSDQTIASGKILTGAQTIKGDADLVAGNIKKNVQIFGVTGSYEGTNTSDATAAAGDIRTGKTAYVNGSKVTGTLAEKSAQTYTPGTVDQTISSGRILTGTQTIKGDAKLVPGNIKKDVQIFGVTGSYEGSGTPKVTRKGSYVTVSPASSKILNVSGLSVSSGETLVGLTLQPGESSITVHDNDVIYMWVLQDGNAFRAFGGGQKGGTYAYDDNIFITFSKSGETGGQLTITDSLWNFDTIQYAVYPIVATVE